MCLTVNICEQQKKYEILKIKLSENTYHPEQKMPHIDIDFNLKKRNIFHSIRLLQSKTS